MNKAVSLITEWGDFDAKHPDGSLEDFCRHYLIRSREKTVDPKLFGGMVPPTQDSALMKLIGRIGKLHAIYAVAALEGTGFNSIEDFSLLNTIVHLKEPRKTDAINANLYEISTGTDMLKRLKKLGYIIEYDDKEDKRAKRLRLSAKGEKVMKQCYKNFAQLSAMLFKDIDPEDKSLCFQLLKGVDLKFSALWQSQRALPFDEIVELNK